ncbi:MAG: M56 family metallopeptidase [Oscillospiraceae bacterium]|nr:M56 family metallopeptidase [Oscillospiraceae bacterium]
MSLLQMSAAGSALILCVAALRALTRRCLPRQTFSLLWLAAALRLLLPVSIPLPVSLPVSVSASLGADTLQSAAAEAAISSSGQALPASAAGAGNESLSAGTEGIPLWAALWLAGSVCLALGFVLLYLRGMRRFRASLPDETSGVRDWLARHRLLRPLQVRRSDLISSPLTYGILRPVILLPRETEDAALRYVLTHEYVHVRRFDGAAKLLFAAALCLHWWNPLAWLMAVLASRDMEFSCDAQALRILGEGERAAYARTLLDMEERRTSPITFSNHFSKTPMQERIEAIVKFKKSSTLSVILAVVLALSSITAFAAPSENSADPSAGGATETSAGETEHESGEVVVLDGEIGQTYVIDDLIFEIVSDEEINQVLSDSKSQTRASTRRWSIDLTGDSMSKSFAVTSSYPYAKVWIQNSGSSDIIFTITKGSSTGTVVGGKSYKIAAGTSLNVWSSNKWSAGTYYANFTSGKADMVGVAACRVASTIAELDI